MKYKYKALNDNNEIIEEYILLNSEKDVLEYLKNSNLRPIKIVEVKNNEFTIEDFMTFELYDEKNDLTVFVNVEDYKDLKM